MAAHVGIGPKWVINRNRMHEAIVRVQAGNAVSWAALAQELGYFDQAHFITDFRKLVGETPSSFASERSARKSRCGACS
jgi:AraC-like DNA-binding protein